MQTITLQQTADFLESANIAQTIDTGHAMIHFGTNVAGIPFVLVNDMHGHSTLTEGM